MLVVEESSGGEDQGSHAPKRSSPHGPTFLGRGLPPQFAWSHSASL